MKERIRFVPIHDKRSLKRPALSSRFGHQNIDEENVRIFRLIFVIKQLRIHFIPRELKRSILLDRRALPIRRSSSVHEGAYSIRTHTRQENNKASVLYIGVGQSAISILRYGTVYMVSYTRTSATAPVQYAYEYEYSTGTVPTLYRTTVHTDLL